MFGYASARYNIVRLAIHRCAIIQSVLEARTLYFDYRVGDDGSQSRYGDDAAHDASVGGRRHRPAVRRPLRLVDHEPQARLAVQRRRIRQREVAGHVLTVHQDGDVRRRVAADADAAQRLRPALDEGQSGCHGRRRGGGRRLLVEPAVVVVAVVLVMVVEEGRGDRVQVRHGRVIHLEGDLSNGSFKGTTERYVYYQLMGSCLLYDCACTRLEELDQVATKISKREMSYRNLLRVHSRRSTLRST